MSLMAISRKIAALEKQMAAAAAVENFEEALRLRDEVAELKGQAPILEEEPDRADTPLVRQPPPGQMGLGTHIPVAAPPEGWARPKRPDPMTANSKSRKR